MSLELNESDDDYELRELNWKWFFYGITCLFFIFGIRFRINGYIRARYLVLKKGIVILVIGTGGIIRVDMSLMKMMIMHWWNGYCGNSYAESIKTNMIKELIRNS